MKKSAPIRRRFSRKFTLPRLQGIYTTIYNKAAEGKNLLQASAAGGLQRCGIVGGDGVIQLFLQFMYLGGRFGQQGLGQAFAAAGRFQFDVNFDEMAGLADGSDVAADFV